MLTATLQRLLCLGDKQVSLCHALPQSSAGGLYCSLVHPTKCTHGAVGTCTTLMVEHTCHRYVLSGRDLREAALVVEKVPISQAAQIRPILQVLRQQICFNLLFQSCFSSSSTASLCHPQHVVEVTCRPPTMISLQLFLPSNFLCFFSIAIELDGVLQVHVGTQQEKLVSMENFAAGLLTQSLNIPLTVNYILEALKSVGTLHDGLL